MLFVFGLCFILVFLVKLFSEVLLDILEEIDLIFIFYIRDEIDIGIFLSFLDMFMLLYFKLLRCIFIIVYGFFLSGDMEWVRNMMLSFLVWVNSFFEKKLIYSIFL